MYIFGPHERHFEVGPAYPLALISSSLLGSWNDLPLKHLLLANDWFHANVCRS